MKAPISEEILARKRRVSLSVEQIALIEQTMRAAMPHFVPAIEIADEMASIIEEEINPEHRRLVDAYRAAVVTCDGEMEMDLDAEVSMGDDPGAYVMVWKWVTNGEADLCEECAGSLDDGEGYDGLCGDCADQAENEEEE